MMGRLTLTAAVLGVMMLLATTTTLRGAEQFADGPAAQRSYGWAGRPSKPGLTSEGPTTQPAVDFKIPVWFGSCVVTNAEVADLLAEFNMEPVFTLTPEQKTKLQEASADCARAAKKWQDDNKAQLQELQKRQPDIHGAATDGYRKAMDEVDKAAKELFRSAPSNEDAKRRIEAVLTDAQKNALEGQIAAHRTEQQRQTKAQRETDEKAKAEREKKGEKEPLDLFCITVACAPQLVSTIIELNMTPEFNLTPVQKATIKIARQDFVKVSDAWRQAHTKEFDKLQHDFDAASRAHDEDKMREAEKALGALYRSAPQSNAMDEKLRAALTYAQGKVVDDTMAKRQNDRTY